MTRPGRLLLILAALVLVALAVVLGLKVWPAGTLRPDRSDRPDQGTAASSAVGGPSGSKPQQADKPAPSREAAKMLKMKTVDVGSLRLAELMSVVRDPSYSPSTRNDATNRLLREGDPRLAGELMRMLNDETEDLTWRNYCLQFLRVCYEQDRQPEVLKALEDACQHRLPELSSCALWGLAQLAVPKPWAAASGIQADRKGGAADGKAKTTGDHGEAPFENPLDRPLLPPESEAKARALALAWLSDDKAHLLTRTAGAQSCSRMGVGDAIPKLRELAAATAEQPLLRTVCIAGLAQLNDQDSAGLLTNLTKDPSARIRQAAEMALRKLNARPQH